MELNIFRKPIQVCNHNVYHWWGFEQTVQDVDILWTIDVDKKIKQIEQFMNLQLSCSAVF